MTTEILDVIVIGAGAAGLTAAYDIHHDTSFTYKILEASDVIGGRLQKLEGFADFPIDIGGEWIHVPPSILDEIYNDPNENPTDTIETVQYIQTYEEWEDEEWNTYDLWNTDYKFKNYTWFDFFNDWMAPGLDVELNCTVDAIDWSSTPVQLSCENGKQWAAKHVIVTSSVKVLQDHDLGFSPSLPQDTQEAIDEHYMLPGLKVFMKFQRRFYKEAFTFVEDHEDNEIPESDKYYYAATFGQDSNDNVLGMFAAGEPAEFFIGMTDNQIIGNLLEQLDDAYDGAASNNFIEGFVQDWTNSTFVKGVYTYLNDDWDSLGSIPTMRQPLKDRVFLAGEAVPADNYEWGFAHEAALSGRFAAERVVELLDD
ncbi:Peroxisomal N(1)-acetyl-spermine/spermidine oxidase [Seminavis robusta]|uniref:Peroxisomal N(1)-acetyl-spermine/spermidine oxidase n=1 Tax=Seminavis robusta TaxID=568900 RepID=A0A9N8HJJ3_9STRA|nr:Peroxisomal N(1)-acetyl-spermine/spermidine oxidase [Seminavis robusta]|eukprot:Sro666_g183980.1 Peroxisomal N(1)-acetyl-spermine/spermidine oxidase (368) ;mRNA; f:24528-25733